ncbi:PREDICTED: uncharacterized protein LOC104810095 isoform X2 [Tarenaya hassleriana]|nr:PREDICTED: uncharacterized protein LOC104810095 isoform X2 [Tarenaya hassleriana]
MCGNGRVIYSHCIRSSGNGISVPPPSNNNPTSDQSKGIWTKVASVAKKGVDGFKSDMKREICCGLRDEFKGEIQGLKDDISKLRDDIYHIKVDVMELKLKNQMQSMMRDIKADVMELKLKNQMQPMMRDLRADVMKLKTEVGQNKMVQNQMVKKMISPCQTDVSLPTAILGATAVLITTTVMRIFTARLVKKISLSQRCWNGRVMFQRRICSSGHGVLIPQPNNNSVAVQPKDSCDGKKGIDGFKDDMKYEIYDTLRGEFKGEIKGVRDDIRKIMDGMSHIKADVMELKLKEEMEDMRADVMKLKSEMEVGQEKTDQSQMEKKMISACRVCLLGSFIALDIKLVMWVFGM